MVGCGRFELVADIVDTVMGTASPREISRRELVCGVPRGLTDSEMDVIAWIHRVVGAAAGKSFENQNDIVDFLDLRELDPRPTQSGIWISVQRENGRRRNVLLHGLLYEKRGIENAVECGLFGSAQEKSGTDSPRTAPGNEGVFRERETRVRSLREDLLCECREAGRQLRESHPRPRLDAALYPARRYRPHRMGLAPEAVRLSSTFNCR